jgi:hypothetical protein
VDDLCTFAELAAGQRVYEGGLAGLTSDEWLSRWLMVSSEPRALDQIRTPMNDQRIAQL